MHMGKPSDAHGEGGGLGIPHFPMRLRCLRQRRPAAAPPLPCCSVHTAVGSRHCLPVPGRRRGSAAGLTRGAVPGSAGVFLSYTAGAVLAGAAVGCGRPARHCLAANLRAPPARRRHGPSCHSLPPARTSMGTTMKLQLKQLQLKMKFHQARHRLLDNDAVHVWRLAGALAPSDGRRRGAGAQ